LSLRLGLVGKYLVVWLSPEAVETFLGVLEPSQEHALTTWTVAGQIIGEAGLGLWVRVKRVLMPRRWRDAAPRGAGLLPSVGTGHDGALVRRAACGRAANRPRRLDPRRLDRD
jgi:hypothetical protein